MEYSNIAEIATRLNQKNCLDISKAVCVNMGYDDLWRALQPTLESTVAYIVDKLKQYDHSQATESFKDENLDDRDVVIHYLLNNTPTNIKDSLILDLLLHSDIFFYLKEGIVIPENKFNQAIKKNWFKFYFDKIAPEIVDEIVKQYS